MEAAETGSLSCTTPPLGSASSAAPRSSIKGSDSATDARSKRKETLREMGRQHRHAILQQHRHSLSPLDLKGKLHEGTMATIRAQLLQPEPDGCQLTQADIDALLDDMEAAVLAEIQAELAEWEAHNQAEAQAAADMAEQHISFLHSAGDGAVLCPVCRGAHLVLRHGLLVCPAQGWRVNVAAEGITLEGVRTRLAAAYEEHATSGCPGSLQFRVDNVFGSDALICGCATCNSLGVLV